MPKAKGKKAVKSGKSEHMMPGMPMKGMKKGMGKSKKGKKS